MRHKIRKFRPAIYYIGGSRALSNLHGKYPRCLNDSKFIDVSHSDDLPLQFSSTRISCFCGQAVWIFVAFVIPHSVLTALYFSTFLLTDWSLMRFIYLTYLNEIRMFLLFHVKFPLVFTRPTRQPRVTCNVIPVKLTRFLGNLRIL